MKGTAYAAKGDGGYLLTVPGDWRAPHAHRLGARDTLPRREVVGLLPTLPYWAGTAKSSRYQHRHGVDAVLGWLESFPGPGWQDRWLAAGADQLPWSRPKAGDLPIEGGVRHDIVTGLRSLLLLRVVAPGYDFFCGYRARSLFGDAADVLYPPQERQRISRALDQLGCFGVHRENVQRTLAKMLLHTGKTIPELESEDFLEVRAWGVAAGRITHHAGVHGAWELAGLLGAATAGRSLKAALREGQRPTAELVDRYGLVCQPIRDALVRYLDERRPALDYSSFRTLVGVLAGRFWGDLEQHNPGLATLHLPPDVATGWKERLKTATDLRSGRPKPRSETDQISIRMKVRAFYLDIQEWALQDASWAAWAVPCPISKSETRGAVKAKKAANARMHQRTRERLPRLGLLVEAAEQARREQRDLLDAATATPITGLFQHAGRSYQRVAPKVYMTGQQARRHDLPDVLVEDVETGERVNVTVNEENAFWAWALIETLRLTGIRIEELLEITHLALVSYTVPDSGEVVPLLQIVPSKTSQERLLLVPPELASVLAAVIARVRGRDGRVPLVARYDPYERVTGPPLPHLFQRRTGWRHDVFSPRYVENLLAATLARADLRDAAGQPLRYTPHDFRRIFATEAVSGGPPVHIAAKILGHEHISTTEHYLAVFQHELISAYRSFLANRRAMRPSAEYREPTAEEWTQFQQHFLLRRVELGSCGRPYQTPCAHEHACIRCAMLRVDQQQRPRLVEIIDNLRQRVTEAEQRGWHGEIQGLQVSLAAAEDKLAGLDRQRQTPLGMPTIRPDSG